MYARGSGSPLFGAGRIGELCLRDSVPVELTKEWLDARGWVAPFSS